MWDELSTIFNAALLRSTIRAATPIIYAAMAALITQKANIMNIGVEGIMLLSTFTAVAVSFFTGSWVLALLASILVGILIAAFMGLAHLKYRANILVLGIAINMFSVGFTRFLGQKVLGAAGSFYSPKIVPMPRLYSESLATNELANELLNNYSLFEPLSFLFVLFLAFILYRTVWGLRIRSVGLHPLAAETAGIDLFWSKFQVIIYSGIISGIAGAHLSLGYSKMYVDNMTSGRGFMGLAAMNFGGGNPIFASLGCLIFGFADSIAARLQLYNLPSQFVLMIPYLGTVVILSIAMIRHVRAEKRQQSSLRSLKK